MIVTFCGHSTIKNQKDVEIWIFETTENLIKEGAKTFYIGGYGDFDNLCKQFLIKHKATYDINICLIVPYLNHNMCIQNYDEIIYPEIENTPLKFAISARNKWIINQSDVVLAYVFQTFGGAYKTYLYAKNKTIYKFETVGETPPLQRQT